MAEQVIFKRIHLHISGSAYATIQDGNLEQPIAIDR
jgi:hypothetical protein